MIEHNLCKEFQALSPFEVDDRPYCDVIKLFADLRTVQIKEKKMNDPNRVIRRKAGDDWF